MATWAEANEGPILVSVAFAIWTAFWLAGFPPPGRDDLFFIGGAIEIFRSGELANGLLRFWHPVSAERFLFQPPLYQWLLAGWLEVFGLSSASVRAFQTSLHLVASCSIGLVLLRMKFHLAAWCLSILLASYIGTQGLRHDILGVALVGLGVAVFAASRLRRVVSLALVALGAIAWPALLAFAFPVAIALSNCGPQVADSPTLRRRALFIGEAALALLAAFTLLLVTIDFRLEAFLGDFAWHASLRAIPLADVLRALHERFTNGYAEVVDLPVFLLAGAIAVAALYRGLTRSDGRVLLVLSAGIVLLAVVYVPAFWTLGALGAWLVILCGIDLMRKKGKRRPSVALVTAFVFVVSQTPTVLACFTAHSERPEDYAALRARLETETRLIGVDDIAARFVYSYRLPPAAYAWTYSNGPQLFWPRSREEGPAGTVWVLGASKAAWCDAVPAQAHLRLLGRTFGSLYAHPYKVLVIQ